MFTYYFTYCRCLEYVVWQQIPPSACPASVWWYDVTNGLIMTSSRVQGECYLESGYCDVVVNSRDFDGFMHTFDRNDFLNLKWVLPDLQTGIIIIIIIIIIIVVVIIIIVIIIIIIHSTFLRNVTSITRLSSKRFTQKLRTYLHCTGQSVIILTPPPRHPHIHSLVKLCPANVH